MTTEMDRVTGFEMPLLERPDRDHLGLELADGRGQSGEVVVVGESAGVRMRCRFPPRHRASSVRSVISMSRSITAAGDSWGKLVSTTSLAYSLPT